MAKKQKTEKPQLPLTQCKGCPKKFYPKDRRQHYHNAKCREAHYAKTFFNKVNVTKICPNCGTHFPTTMPTKQKFCSDGCRIDNHRKQLDTIQDTLTTERTKFYGDRFKTLQSAKFRCSYCGKDVSDGVKLDVEPDGKKGYRSICSECVVGKNYQE